MDRKNLKIVCIILLVLIVVVGILLLVLPGSTDTEDPDTSSNNSTNNSSNSTNNNTENNVSISLLNDVDMYFTVQNIINDYYNILISNNSNDISNVIVDYYEDNYGLSNINTNYYEVSYVAEDIYSASYNSIRYYFVHGYLISYSYVSDNVLEDNINYIVLIQNGKYNIYPLGNIDYETYLDNYVFSDSITVSNGESYESVSINEESKLITYISLFKNLLLLDTNKAYSYLSSDMKEYYGSYSNFYDLREDIFNNISSSVFSYNLTDNVYNIMDNNGKNIKIYEENVMNYTIEFES